MFQVILSIFKNLLRNWDWGDHPPTLLGTIPKFNRFFILKASVSMFRRHLWHPRWFGSLGQELPDVTKRFFISDQFLWDLPRFSKYSVKQKSIIFVEDRLENKWHENPKLRIDLQVMLKESLSTPQEKERPPDVTKRLFQINFYGICHDLVYTPCIISGRLIKLMLAQQGHGFKENFVPSLCCYVYIVHSNDILNDTFRLLIREGAMVMT